MTSFPLLVQTHSVITVDLQGHGRTADIPERPITFEQHAKDVVGLSKYLGISKADFFGESFGGVIATMIAVHYPKLSAASRPMEQPLALRRLPSGRISWAPKFADP